MNSVLERTRVCWVVLLLCTTSFLPAAHAQWLTQSIELKAGWNAVFLHVEPDHLALDSWIGEDNANPIVQVWRWNPPSGGVFVDDPQGPVFNASGWISWVRSEPDSILERMAGDTAYLVESAADYTWPIKGRPVAPRPGWNTQGHNLVGFATVPVNSPSFDRFLAEAPELQSPEVEIYRYDGPELDGSNPRPVPPVLYRNTPVTRGQAFWMRSGTLFNQYFGPFEVVLAGSSGINFYDHLGTFRVRLRNLSPRALTVSATLLPSEPAPAGEEPISAITPLLVRGSLDLNTQEYGFSELGEGDSTSWTLAARDEPGSEVEVVLGLDRSSITQDVGSLLAGVLRFTDSLDISQVDLPVTATVASDAGLWVGEAWVTRVGQYLKTYEDGAADPIFTTNGNTVVTNDLVIAPEGNYVVTDVDTQLTDVEKWFPLRLIVHVPEGAGEPTLLQRVYYGSDVYSNQVISRVEEVLDPERLGEARRISATHLPWSDENTGWTFNRELGPDVWARVAVTNDYRDHQSNPFLHTYHPDHDNLDPRFEYELPRGSESYTVARTLRLKVTDPGANFLRRVAGGTTVTGDYWETIRMVGLARAGGTADTRMFPVRGVFRLDRISDIDTLTDPL